MKRDLPLVHESQGRDMSFYPDGKGGLVAQAETFREAYDREYGEPPWEELGDDPFRVCSECGHPGLEDEGDYFGVFGVRFVCGDCLKEQDDE